MITLRRASERGHADHGWLDSHHTFSFADYHDPEHMGFRALRVINEDRVQGGKGFGTHGHRDMEIVSYVLDGGLEHKDSMGTGSTIRPGDVQRMSAGTGVMHSEYNASKSDPVHFMQIWILPADKGLAPSYEQKNFSEADRSGKLRVVASRDGHDGSLVIHQDVAIHAGLLAKGERAELALEAGRFAWVQLARGEIALNGVAMKPGDGARVEREAKLTLEGTGADAEVLVFDLA